MVETIFKLFKKINTKYIFVVDFGFLKFDPYNVCFCKGAVWAFLQPVTTVDQDILAIMVQPVMTDSNVLLKFKEG